MHLLTPALDLNELAKRLAVSGRFSFAAPQRLADTLKVLPGSVTPFAVCNDSECKVRVVLDERMRNSATISAHPLVNTKTTTIAMADLFRLFEHTGHRPQWCALPLKAVG
jgi:Ala-tRNA(Pro) deacylase